MSTALDKLFLEIGHLSTAEEFLGHFGIESDPAIVRVNRLHILKRFQQYLAFTPGLATLDDDAVFRAVRALLQRAYDDFVRSSPLKERVFKVLQDAEGQRVGIDKLRRSLPSQRQGR
jgi:nitrogenase-stabilizing/protective protein